jgi:hypothetical protein
MFIHSGKNYIERSMYLIDPYRLSITNNIPRIGLVGEWLFSNDFKDTSGYGNNLASFGNCVPTTDRKNQANYAAHFSGISGNAIGVGVISALQINTNITISIWVKVAASLSNGATVIECNWNSGYRIKLGPAAIVFFDRGAANYTIAPCSPYNGSWTHILCTGGPFGIRTYLNGNLIYTGGSAFGGGYTGSCSIGGSGGEAVVCDIDDVRIYNRVLTDVEIAQLYNE